METSTSQPELAERAADAATLQADRALIESLGGPTAVARLLNFGMGGAQRVSNWRVRGIPPKVKLQHPQLFLAHLPAAATTPTEAKAS